jgi:hypothetical protein
MSNARVKYRLIADTLPEGRSDRGRRPLEADGEP